MKPHRIPITTVATLLASLLAMTAVAMSAPLSPDERLARKMAGLPDCELPIAKLTPAELTTCQALSHFDQAARDAQQQELRRPSPPAPVILRGE